MARHVFYALHYAEDRSRASGILESTTLSANLEASKEEWAKLQRSGEFAIQRWVEGQLKGRSCTIVLIGAHTSLRPWVQYEIRRSRQLKIAMIGVHIHQLADAQGKTSAKGENPFEHPQSELGSAARTIPVYDPPEGESRVVQKHILENIGRWATDAAGERRPWQ